MPFLNAFPETARYPSLPYLSLNMARPAFLFFLDLFSPLPRVCFFYFGWFFIFIRKEKKTTPPPCRSQRATKPKKKDKGAKRERERKWGCQSRARNERQGGSCDQALLPRFIHTCRVRRESTKRGKRKEERVNRKEGGRQEGVATAT